MKNKARKTIIEIISRYDNCDCKGNDESSISSALNEVSESERGLLENRAERLAFKV